MLKKAKEILVEGEYTFAAIKNDNVYTSKLHGIAPIMIKLEEDKEYLSGAVAADKVIGKAAAMLLIYGGIKALYARTISEHALAILQDSGILVETDKVVPYIINRKGDGMCPMEEAVLHETDCQKAYEILKNKLEEMRKK